MNKNVKWVISLVVFALLLTGAVLGYNYLKTLYSSDQLAETQNEDTSEENPAPEFSVIDIDGNIVKLSNFSGKPVIINFWASWCPPCKNEMPDFNEKYLEYKDEIHFVMVNLTDGRQETKESAEKFLATTDYTFPVYFDSDLSGAYTYGIYSVPQTFFIDAEGVLVTGAQGAISGYILQKGIDFIYEK